MDYYDIDITTIINIDPLENLKLHFLITIRDCSS